MAEGLKRKETIVFDFDGVIHSYTSGWQGVDKILDPPTPGIKEFIDDLRNDGYEIIVVSTRCHQKNGYEAIEKWLEAWDIVVDDIMANKPPAKCYIDDRAICFNPNDTKCVNGQTDYLNNVLRPQIDGFKPWAKNGAILYDIINDDGDVDNLLLKDYVNKTSKELRIVSQIKRSPEKIAAVLDKINEDGFHFAFDFIQDKIERDMARDIENSKEGNLRNLEKLVLIGQLETYIDMCEAQYRFLFKLCSLRDKIRTEYMRKACDEVCRELRHDGIRACVGDIIVHTNISAEAIIDVINAMNDIHLIKITTIDEQEVNDTYKVLWDNEQDLNMLFISSDFASNLLLAINDAGSLFNYKIRR